MGPYHFWVFAHLTRSALCTKFELKSDLAFGRPSLLFEHIYFSIQFSDE